MSYSAEALTEFVVVVTLTAATSLVLHHWSLHWTTATPLVAILDHCVAYMLLLVVSTMEELLWNC